MKKEDGAGCSGRAFIFHCSLFIFHLFVLLSCSFPTGEEGVGSGGTGDALEKTVIDGKGVLELTAYILRPVTGGTPARSFAASTFAGIVSWTAGDGQGMNGVFRAGVSYTAAAMLFPRPGYVFGEMEGDITDNHDGTVTARIVFEK